MLKHGYDWLRAQLASVVAALALLFLIRGARGFTHTRGMAALIPGRGRLRKATFAVSSDDDDDFDALFGNLAIDAPARSPVARRPTRGTAAAPARTPASARKGGLDGDAWSRVEALADEASPGVASDDGDGDSWLASEDDEEPEAEDDDDESFVASEAASASDDDSVLDLTTPPKAESTPPKPESKVLVDLTNGTPSPRAPSTTKKKTKKQPRAPSTPEGPPDLSVATPRAVAKSFARRRGLLLQSTFDAYDAAVVGGRLAGSVECVWSKRLRTTSGLTRMSQKRDHKDAPWVKKAVIEMSTHVCDSEEKMKNTLAHELCHAAAWVVDGVSKPPHGAPFKRWAARFMDAFDDLHITTRHSYAINYKFNWRCSDHAACDFTIGRHSNSLDIKKYVCGKCAAKLEPYEPSN